MKLYSKEFEQIDANRVRVMEAKAVAHLSSGSKKLQSIHIAPYVLGKYSDHSCREFSSSDRCVRLNLSKPYLASQKRKMLEEVRGLARDRLASCMCINDPRFAPFRECLEFLTTVNA